MSQGVRRPVARLLLYLAQPRLQAVIGKSLDRLNILIVVLVQGVNDEPIRRVRGSKSGVAEKPRYRASSYVG